MGYEFIRSARQYLLYSISFVLYCLTAPHRFLSRSSEDPEKRKKVLILVSIVAIAMIAAAVIIDQSFVQQQQNQPDQQVPNVKFMTFEVDKQELVVGESANILINVQSSEDTVIRDATAMITIEPSSYSPYLSISNSPIQLPVFLGQDARTGEVNVSITATASPAQEAIYLVKGTVFVNDIQTDIREFPLTIRQ
jgi:hypothetical protein